MPVHGDPLTRRWLLLVLCVAACGREASMGTSAKHGAVPPDTMALRAPDGSVPPTGELGRSILRGHAILANTWDSLPTHVGNGLRCTSCHLDDGRRPHAIPLTGVYGRYPQYRSRMAAVQTIEDRVNDCFQRSLNGKALLPDSPDLRDIMAYLAWISKGIGVGDTVPGQAVRMGKALHGDTVTGGRVFVRECARCHGLSGEGTVQAPPVWGDRSFSIGAGMARMFTLTGFIRDNMPFDRRGTLSDSDAVNVAAYIASRPRKDFAGKEKYWPRGDTPADVAYPTRNQ